MNSGNICTYQFCQKSGQIRINSLFPIVIAVLPLIEMLYHSMHFQILPALFNSVSGSIKLFHIAVIALFTPHDAV